MLSEIYSQGLRGIVPAVLGIGDFSDCRGREWVRLGVREGRDICVSACFRHRSGSGWSVVVGFEPRGHFSSPHSSTLDGHKEKVHSVIGLARCVSGYGSCMKDVMME